MTPTIGRIVHVRDLGTSSTDMPAIVTHVTQRHGIYVTVFPADRPPYCLRHVEQIQMETNHAIGWYWPPRIPEQ